MAAALAIVSALLVAVQGAPSGILRGVHLQPVSSQQLDSAHISPTARIASSSGLSPNAAVYVIPTQSDASISAANQHMFEGFALSTNPYKHIPNPSDIPVTHGLIKLSGPPPSAVATAQLLDAQIPEVLVIAPPATAGLLSVTSAKAFSIPSFVVPASLVNSVVLEPAASLRFGSSGIPINGKGQTLHSSLSIPAPSQEQASELFPHSASSHQQRWALEASSASPVNQHVNWNQPKPSEVKLSGENIQPSTLNLKASSGQQIQPITSVLHKQLQPTAPEIVNQSSLQKQNWAKNQDSPAGSTAAQWKHSLNPSAISNAPSPVNSEENLGRSSPNHVPAGINQSSASNTQKSVGNLILNSPSASVETPASTSAKSSLGNSLVSQSSNAQINPSSTANIQSPPGSTYGN